MELESETKTKKSSCWTPVLCSWSIFTTCLCVILISALVLIGKEYLTAVCPIDRIHPRHYGYTPKDFYYEYPRLPSTTRAYHYNLTLIPNLHDGNFRGFVNITIRVMKPTSKILLHSKHLNIRSVHLSRNGSEEKVIGVKEIKNSQVISIDFIDLVQGDYFLALNFNGSMLNKLNGFYLSRYKNEDNETRTIATSKFEPTFARQAFPNFDEPNMKATYEIHLWKPNDPEYIALSNYPQKSEEDYEGGKLVHFEKTVSMSTYLVCFIVSDFTCTTTHFNNSGVDIPFRVYATPDQLNKTSYAGEVGKKCIEYYVDYFKIPYPLPKLDMVAIPDFSSGAMEHWGLVTYRETALLFTPETHSSANQQRVITVIAHELAHSWFGNLVTMNWWDNLWLNEGFASYIEYKGAHAAEPTFGMMDQFLIEDLHPVLSLDAKLSSHAIIKEVNTPNQITEVFDAISYNKGASVLRMLENSVGPENFSKGVTNYLNKYKYGNAVTDQLWEEIQKVVGSSVNISNFMDTFTKQMGYPILEVNVAANKFTLTQKRFLLDPEQIRKSADSPFDYKWTIPVTYITDQGKSEVFWFKNDQPNLEIERPTNAKWLKFNYDQAGYYRVNYPESMWKELIDNVHKFSISDRAHLIEESFSIAESGAISYSIPLELTKYLKNETDYVPWEAASDAFHHLGKYLSSSLYENEFKNYVLGLVKPAYEDVTWKVGEGDGHLKRRARVVIIKLACYLGHEDALKEANSLLEEWLDTRTAHPDLREIIYEFGVQNADKSTWQKVFDIFVEEKDANEKLKLLKGLASVRNPSLVSRLLQLAKDDTYIRSQDYFHCLSYMSSNPISSPLVWDYVRDNWDKIVDRFGLSDRYLGNVIPTITSRFVTKIKLTEMENFFTAYPEAGAGAAARKRALENVANNIQWLKKHRDDVEGWIVKNSS